MKSNDLKVDHIFKNMQSKRKKKNEITSRKYNIIENLERRFEWFTTSDQIQYQNNKIDFPR